MIRVRVDFEDIEDSGRLTALPLEAGGPLARGAVVALYDDRGNTAVGSVLKVGDGGLVLFDVTEFQPRIR
jgi:hypothetical protein